MPEPASSTYPPPAPPPFGSTAKGKGPPPRGTARLARSTDDAMLGGVCGGVARHLGMDPTLVRIGAVVGIGVFGVGMLAYLIAWVVLPTDAGVARDPHGPSTFAGRGLGGVGAVGVGLAGLGALLLLAHLDDVVDVPFVPLALLAVGAWLLWGRRNDGGGDGAGPRVEPPWSAGPPPPTTVVDDAVPVFDPTLAPTVPARPTDVPEMADRPWRATTDVDPTWEDLDEPVWDAAAGRWISGAIGAPAGSPPGAGYGPTGAGAGPAGRRTRGLAIVLGGILVALGLSGLAVLLGAGANGFTLLAGGLVVAGIVITVGSLLGGAKRLVPGALVGLAVLSGVAVLDVPLEGGVGERTVTYGADGEPSGQPRLIAGELTVDLRDLDPALAADVARIEASVAMGALVVRLPGDLDVQVDASASLGAVTVPDGSDPGGAGIEYTERYGPNADEPDVEPDLVIDLQVGLGEVEVLLDAG